MCLDFSRSFGGQQGRVGTGVNWNPTLSLSEGAVITPGDCLSPGEMWAQCCHILEIFKRNWKCGI